MSDSQDSQPKPLEEASRKELNQIADEFGVSKQGTDKAVINRIRAAKNGDVSPDEPKQDPPTPVVRRKRPEEIFSESMKDVSLILADSPSVLDIIRVKRKAQTEDSEFTVDGYAWADKSASGKNTRKKIKKILESAWQSCALNYESISRNLRVSDMSVRALLDEEFIAANGF